MGVVPGRSTWSLGSTMMRIGHATAACTVMLVACVMPQPFETRVTPVQLHGEPLRYKFDVYGDPGIDPELEASSLPGNEKIRVGMHRYAELELAKRGLCP